MTTLVVVAHPDDEVLGCGGTIARLTSEGEEVHIAILGEGGTSREPGAVTALRRQAAQAAQHLGTQHVSTYPLPDQRFDTVPLLEITQIVEGMIDEVKPDTVFTHAYDDLNEDHRVTHQAVLTACRPLPGAYVKTVYAIEIPGSTGNFGTFTPNAYIAIAATLERKVEAMEIYESEARGWPHARSPQALRDLAHFRGIQVGLDAAEAFQIVRAILP